ncbi:hypothetical protein GTA51_15305 [Desulfovibrio aerotolerans]|uniref:Uncharacterized protein n=1 Tax=Solidesulfovibrio aerotolerans TaxID=295255 RepID=A0A7C9MK97_9BACT|nr:hypothetical protein [Solidesulfovibrio aerotolerans]MYL84488.1 hypothetical protein [Solidesulfovibrio aerotolerans]
MNALRTLTAAVTIVLSLTAPSHAFDLFGIVEDGDQPSQTRAAISSSKTNPLAISNEPVYQGTAGSLLRISNEPVYLGFSSKLPTTNK